MTVDTTSSGGIQPYDPEAMAGLGFEDIGAGDMTMPRLTINHKESTFKNGLSNEEFPVLRCVLLGVIKQRVMWDEKVDDGDKPMCKSPNHSHGFPNLNPDVVEKKRFPWEKSNFEPSQAQPVDLDPSGNFPDGWSSNGLPVLPCAACIFKEWDKGDWHQPLCSEQHTYPLMYQTEDGGLMPALVTFQRTGIKPSKTYINAFVQSNTPMFTQWTEIKLTQFSRGTVDYCVPSFKKAGETDRDMWGEFAQQYRGVRNFVRQAPRNADEEEGAEGFTPSDNKNTAPPAPTAAVAAASPSPTPSTPPSVPAASPTSPAPVSPSVTQPPVATPAPVSTVTPASADDDDLPF